MLSDPTFVVTVVASIALVVFIAIVTFFAVAPLVSDTWAERLDPASHGGLEGEPQHGD